jgi:AraC-like DNA-binding protein
MSNMLYSKIAGELMTNSISQLTFEYHDSDVTRIAPSHTSGWRIMPIIVLVIPRPISGAENDDNLVKYETADKTYKIKNGEAVIVPENTSHCFSNIEGKDSLSYWCHFQLKYLQITDIYYFYDIPTVISGNQTLTLAEYCREMSIIAKNAQNNDFAAGCRLQQVGFKMAELIINNSTPKNDSNISPDAILRFQPLLEYIKNNIEKKITLEKMARIINLSTSNFRKIFTETFGTTPGDYVIQYRLKQASNLLAYTKMNISEIASELGFCDQFNFSKVFKKRFKISPREYRKNLYNVI